MLLDDKVPCFSKFLPREEELRLSKLKWQGDIEARNILVESILPYARSIVLKKAASSPVLDELLQEAYYAVIRAVDSFDAEHSTLSTYVTRPVIWALQHHNCHLVKLPDSVFKKKDEAVLKTTYREFSNDDLVDGETTLDVVLMREEDSEVKNLVNSLMSILTEREKDIILRRLDGETLLDIGTSYGVCKERIRQIETAAKKKMLEHSGTIF